MDLLERMLLATTPTPEFEAEFQARAGDLTAEFERSYPWIRRLFRKVVGRDQAAVEDLVNETFVKYLAYVKTTLWRAEHLGMPLDEDTLNPAFRWIARRLKISVKAVKRDYLLHGQHEDLVDQFYGLDEITQEDLEEDLRREQIIADQSFSLSDLQQRGTVPTDRVLRHTGQWLKVVAENVFNDYCRKRKNKLDCSGDEDLRTAEAKAITRGY